MSSRDSAKSCFSRSHEQAEATCLHSGPPWHISLTIETDGEGFACRISRGLFDGEESPAHAAVTRTQWCVDRASAQSSTGGDRYERRVATDAAHRLCKGARCSVTCTVDLGLDRCTDDEVDAVVRASSEVAAAMAHSLAEQRIRTAVVDPDGVLARLLAPASDGLEERVDRMLHTPIDDLLAEHGEAIAESHVERLGGRVLIFAPLYVSSACLNDCTYCGFRKSASIERVRLDVDQALVEARWLADAGHRTLDLVTGEIPTDAFIDHVGAVCRRILDDSPIERIHLNLGALSGGQYARLRSAGASGYHLYQETYDPDVYLSVHQSGPKRDMANRLESSRRVLRAGFEGIGLGVLLGLAPVRDDLVRLARHAHLLLREFPGTTVGFSLPRIQDAGQEAGFVQRAGVADDTFMKAFLFLRLEFPDAQLTLTTRESPRMRDMLLGFGATKLSAGVSTAPGGYSAPTRREAAAQFSICDERPLEEIAERVRAAGLTPAFA